MVASLVVEQTRFSSCSLWVQQFCGSRALEHKLASCGSQPQLLCGKWDLPGLGIDLVSPALADRLFTTEPPGKRTHSFFFFFNTLLHYGLTQDIKYSSLYKQWDLIICLFHI